MRELSVNTTFVVLPLAGGGTSLRTFNAGGRYFFTHVINTYEEGEGDAATLVFDACVSHLNPFHSTAIAIAAQRNKTRRDAGSAMMHARRFVIRIAGGAARCGEIRGEMGRHGTGFRIAGPRRGEVVSSLLSRAGREADFPQIDSRYRGRKHCIYWAVLWRADGVAYGAMAIDRTDVCRGEPCTRRAGRHASPLSPLAAPASRQSHDVDAAGQLPVRADLPRLGRRGGAGRADRDGAQRN